MPDLVLLVGAARSGTTLLRLMLDAHPEIGCPAEAGVPSMIQSLGAVWGAVDSQRRDSSSLGDLPSIAQRGIQSAVLAPMAYYCSDKGSRIYCDKSLDSVHHLESVNHVFPDTRCILLFRHVMDTVASGLEACPWGFQGYGYQPYVQASPDNFVAALVSYWLTHVDKALRWENAHPKLCHRVHYEDLVTTPGDTMSRIFEFLGVDADLGVVSRAFAAGHLATGLGDYKVSHTSSVLTSSIGRGRRVPVAMVPPPLLEATNRKMLALGYQPLSKAWNTEPARGAGAGSAWRARLIEQMRLCEMTVTARAAEVPTAVAVVADDEPDLRWVINTELGIRQGDGEVDSVVTGTTEDLWLMLSGEVNVGVLLRSGRIRHLTANEALPQEEVVRQMRRTLDLLVGEPGAARPGPALGLDGRASRAA